MWNSFTTDASEGIRTEVITYPGGNGDQIHAYVARPTGGATAPGIVAVHHMPGWDEFYREFSDRLARHGYTVICPDLYCRYGHGTPDDIAAKVRAEGGVPDESVVADGAAAADWLRAQPTSNGKVGIIGTCSGGRHALLTASKAPGFDAVADLWGGGVIMSPDELSPARPVAPIDYTADLTAPLLGIFGNDDRYPTPEPSRPARGRTEAARQGLRVPPLRRRLARLLLLHAPMYRPEQAMDGWEKVFDFFGRHLG